ncbi:MAG: hydrogenase maturation nickel metallochaperone HypA [Holdemanella sp.]|nr:hydrogenase maturation nickel metallochaperone HypA [Holdemanella sp.]
MHELSVVQGVVSTTHSFLEENQIDHVEFLVLVVGDHTGVIPRYLKMYYPDVCKGTRLEGSELLVERVPTEYFCKECGNVFSPIDEDHHHMNGTHCPECQCTDLECIRGDELMIKEVRY